jgi:hypothetical protein
MFPSELFNSILANYFVGILLKVNKLNPEDEMKYWSQEVGSKVGSN